MRREEYPLVYDGLDPEPEYADDGDLWWVGLIICCASAVAVTEIAWLLWRAVSG
jgi:hypothetical protein